MYEKKNWAKIHRIIGKQLIVSIDKKNWKSFSLYLHVHCCKIICYWLLIDAIAKCLKFNFKNLRLPKGIAEYFARESS